MNDDIAALKLAAIAFDQPDISGEKRDFLRAQNIQARLLRISHEPRDGMSRGSKAKRAVEPRIARHAGNENLHSRPSVGLLRPLRWQRSLLLPQRVAHHFVLRRGAPSP